jgi:hypothetical protein
VEYQEIENTQINKNQVITTVNTVYN